MAIRYRLPHLDWRSRDVLILLTGWIFLWSRNYATTQQLLKYDHVIYMFLWSNLSRCQPEKMNFLALQVTEIFDLNGKPQKS